MEIAAPAHHRPGWSILLSLLLVPPIGIMVMWRHADWPDWMKTLCTLGFGWVALMEGVFLFGFLGVVAARLFS
jgi:hypothetical protein